jgi:hypothetical protein
MLIAPTNSLLQEQVVVIMFIMITKDEAEKALVYDPELGVFRWLINKPPRARVGKVAGYHNGNGYVRISLSGKKIYAHQLAFLLMVGEVPMEIDHINHCKSDNRWLNLRESCRAENCANVPSRKGIRQRYGRWYARYAARHLGVFLTKEEAVFARKKAEIAQAGVDPNKLLPVLPSIKAQKATHKLSLYEGKSLSEWSRITNIPQPTLHDRINRQNLSFREAISRGSSIKKAVDACRLA